MRLPRLGEPKISLRRYPYPFRAALALSNDAEFLTPRAFWDLHRFLNTTDSTPLGPGLGLQIGDSAFMYSVAPERSFSYFDGTGDRLSRHAGWMRELMQEGVLDVLHAYGDFDGVGGFTRAHAERALGELERNQIRLQVWTNHGTVENTQNLGTDRAYYQRGDLPSADEYHADLTLAYGLRFCWLDFNATNVFGNTAGPIRQSRLRSFRNAGQDEHEPLLTADAMRDGGSVYLFQRYRGPDRPDPSSLASQLSAANLDSLCGQEAVAIVYQHLGATAPRASASRPRRPISRRRRWTRCGESPSGSRTATSSSAAWRDFCGTSSCETDCAGRRKAAATVASVSRSRRSRIPFSAPSGRS